MTPEIKMVAVNSLVPYARNARTHSDAQVAQIAASIAEFGFTNPILTDGARGVIAGHGRLAAARKLALTDVPVIELSHLTAIQKKAYILADNRIAANAGWDEELLKLELVELDEADFNLELMGFDAEEIERLLHGDDDKAGLTDDDAVPEVAEDAVHVHVGVGVPVQKALVRQLADARRRQTLGVCQRLDLRDGHRRHPRQKRRIASEGLRVQGYAHRASLERTGGRNGFFTDKYKA